MLTADTTLPVRGDDDIARLISIAHRAVLILMAICASLRRHDRRSDIWRTPLQAGGDIMPPAGAAL